MSQVTQASVDAANRQFWEDLCGSHLASTLGTIDGSPTSLAKFDEWYFAYYPYLIDFLQEQRWRDKRVLEVGIGYGSVGERLARTAGEFTALDIAITPIVGMQARLRNAGLRGTTIVGNVLDAPLPSDSFDCVVSIGCLHHTGDLPRALREIHRVLKPGGVAKIMIYSAYSYRRWVTAPHRTLSYWLADFTRAESIQASSRERAMYDTNLAGNAAPQTVFSSPRGVRRMAGAGWSHFEFSTQNAAAEPPLHLLPRPVLLRTIGRLAGIDLYCTMTKSPSEAHTTT
jgi:SAM-dependent methyltransferase